MAIRLIAGLGNPGPRYARTRHNIGAAWLERLAERCGAEWKEQVKFKGRLARVDLLGHDVRLLLPATYVNLSGDAVGAVARFYRIPPDELLVAHDEVAFAVGVARLKAGGGHNGHRGLVSVIAALGDSRGFARLRIGVGHPGAAEDMAPYLTDRAMPRSEADAALAAAQLDDDVLGLVLRGEVERAMNRFHAPRPDAAAAVG